jgi:lipopolysaccharide/colanic/teichoic acid biosynthesis glycosyltransferase
MRILLFQDEIPLLTKVCLSRPLGVNLMTQWAQKYADDQGSAEMLLPDTWLRNNPQLKTLQPFSYESHCWKQPEFSTLQDDEDMYLINGHCLFSVDFERIKHALDAVSWQAATIQVTPRLQVSRETLKLTSDSRVVGFRRFYNASIEPTTLPNEWPAMMIFKRSLWDTLYREGGIPLKYEDLLLRIQQQGISPLSLRVGGQLRRLDTSDALLDCLELLDLKEQGQSALTEPVFMGENVTVEDDVSIVGPVVLSENVHIKSGAVVRRSILGEGVVVKTDQVINNQICFQDFEQGIATDSVEWLPMPDQSQEGFADYRSWQWFSYARMGKRLFDIAASGLVLILLMPILLVVSIVVKLTSPGPVFYRARRQGRHGKEFDCLKFRSMIIAADEIQERLRVVNQVDGPQFKMENDPRITGVGKFLRDTFIDELPQFFNVLVGQMSIVGPRPSPENENDSSPAWRDARLSVRPGITGLWQIMRTRKEGVDFQEWVFYDTRYVRRLSFRKDMWICWKTAQKLVQSFLGQFG